MSAQVAQYKEFTNKKQNSKSREYKELLMTLSAWYLSSLELQFERWLVNNFSKTCLCFADCWNKMNISYGLAIFVWYVWRVTDNNIINGYMFCSKIITSLSIFPVPAKQWSEQFRIVMLTHWFLIDAKPLSLDSYFSDKILFCIILVKAVNKHF